MNVEKTPEEQLADILANEVNRIMRAGRGSGATVDYPCRLGAMHALLAPMVEKSLVSGIYGKENIEWFDAGRMYHRNDTMCEQRVRLGVRVKPTWAQPGETYSIFFDISELTHEAPIPDVVKHLLMSGALKMPLRDITLVSRFPLIEVRAKDATEAARIIAGHLRVAEAEGWKTGEARALVDNWRNEYDLTKGNERTVMQFDMRPCLLSDSPLNLTALTLLAVEPKLEDGLRKLESSMPPKASPLPSAQPESPQWFYYVNRRRHGPVSQQALISMIENGAIDQKTIARPADDPGEGGWTIEDLQKSKTLPLARRVFPALRPNASKAERIIRAFEEKQGKLLAEMSPTQLYNFTDEVTRDVPWTMAIAFFKGTTAEPVLRRARQRYSTLFVAVVVGLVLAVGFGIAAALWIAALSRSAVFAILAGLVLARLVWLGGRRVIDRFL
jgi:hypothetical protein